MARKVYEAKGLVASSRYQRFFPTLAATTQGRVLARVSELIEESRELCDDGNCGHLSNMFTCLAIYETLQAEGATKEEAFRAASEPTWEFVEATPAGTYRKLFSKPGVLWLIGKLLPRMFAKGSGAGWEYVWHPETASGSYLQFECRRCIYPGFFAKYGVPELGPIFCHADDINYGSIPGITFTRNHTLCVDGQACDFKFEKK